MANVNDVIIDETGDEVYKNGDLLVDECTHQCQKLLLLTEKGSLKHEPTTGVGIATFILDEADGNTIKREIQSEFEADGLQIKSLTVNSLEDIRITASYE
jgi:hypothetical protein